MIRKHSQDSKDRGKKITNLLNNYDKAKLRERNSKVDAQAKTHDYFNPTMAIEKWRLVIESTKVQIE